jgi:broad-specificity NMP kinase
MAAGAPIVFEKLENAQNVGRVLSVYSDGKPLYDLKPYPILVIVAGAPGVGKTSKIREILKSKLDFDYNRFVNISLDALVERVKPYRAATKRVYNTLKSKHAAAENLTNDEYAILSEFYLPVAQQAVETNFRVPQTEARILGKIEALATATASAPKSTARRSTAKKSATAAATNENAIKKLKTLNEMRQEAFKEAVKNGLNIIYDTTLRPNSAKTEEAVIKRDILPVLNDNPDKKYKVLVILIKAEEEEIKERIRGRHREMLAENNSYVRAINPKLTKMFLEQNKEGYDLFKKYIKDGIFEREYPRSIYSDKDFAFAEIRNPRRITNITTPLKKNKNKLKIN